MSILRPFRATDLFSFNNINLDYWTETYSLSFYQSYLATWPELCVVAEHPSSTLMGYVIGKVEGRGTDYHGHVTALSISPSHRRINLATVLMDVLERVSDEMHKGWFVDLFVRLSNATAIGMYKRLGYSVFRRVVGYYGDDEDAYDMRKQLSRDTKKISIRDNGEDVRVSPEEVVF